jgi:hypothetical protein
MEGCMADVMRAPVRLIEHVTIVGWDHDCPALHGGTCPPTEQAETWAVNGQPVEDEAEIERLREEEARHAVD